MESTMGKRIHFVEVAKDVYAALTPAQPLDITDAGMMDNFSNAACITRGQGLVCDTYFDLPHARELREFCIAKQGHAPGIVVNTHGHWDHYWGNQVFSEAVLMGQEDMLADCAGDKGKLAAFKVLTRSKAVRSLLDKAMGAQFKEQLAPGQRFRMVVEQDGQDFDLHGVVPTPPQKTFRNKTTLDLDGIEVQLLPLGAIHSSSDTVVWLPAERVLFAGDIFADCSLPMSVTGAKKWIAAMGFLLDELQPEVIVPGHGIVYDRARAENQRDYFKALLAQFEKYYSPTIRAEDLCALIDVQEFLDHRPRLAWVMSVKAMVSEQRKKG